MSYVEDNDHLGEFQGAFHKGHRSEDSIFALKGVCAIQKIKKGGESYLAFLDILKAFNMLNRKKLFIHM